MEAEAEDELPCQVTVPGASCQRNLLSLEFVSVLRSVLDLTCRRDSFVRERESNLFHVTREDCVAMRRIDTPHRARKGQT